MDPAFLKEMQTANAYGPGETLRERDGRWWWADEAGEWHGPCSSKESAQKRQSLYVTYIMGELDFVSFGDWLERKAKEDDDVLHPCNAAEPWDCDCAGSCS